MKTRKSAIPTMRPRVPTMDYRTAKPQNKQVDQELKGPDYERWRFEIIKRAGYRCQAVDSGTRCPVKAPSRLFADHIIERRDGGELLDLDNGQCLCGRHHTLKTARARAERMKDSSDGGNWWL